MTPGRPRLVNWPSGLWNGIWALADSLDFWNALYFWDADDLALGMEDDPCVWTDGSREQYPTGGFEVAGASVILPVRSVVMPGWSVAGHLCWCWVLSRLSSVLNSGSHPVLAGLLAWRGGGERGRVLMTLMWSGPSVGCWIMVASPLPPSG